MRSIEIIDLLTSLLMQTITKVHLVFYTLTFFGGLYVEHKFGLMSGKNSREIIMSRAAKMLKEKQIRTEASEIEFKLQTPSGQHRLTCVLKDKDSECRFVGKPIQADTQ